MIVAPYFFSNLLMIFDSSKVRSKNTIQSNSMQIDTILN
jgi:hypothetical protein